MMNLFRLVLLLLVLVPSVSAQITGPATNVRFGPTDPTTCQAGTGMVFWNTTSGLLKGCNSTDTWTSVGGAGSGDALVADPLSQFASTTSAQLAGVISNETGTSLLVYNTSPTLVTPVLGVATATSINKVAITAPATSATLVLADGKTLTASNTLTLTGTDASSVAFGAGGTVLYSGGALGTPSSGTLTNATGLPPATGIVGWPANASGALTNDGAGVLSWAAAGGSQTPWTGAIDGDGFALSDVGDLIPRAGSSLGSAAIPWVSSFTGNTTQYESVVQTAGKITHAALGSATNIGFQFTGKGTGAVNIETAANSDWLSLLYAGSEYVRIGFGGATGYGMWRGAVLGGGNVGFAAGTIPIIYTATTWNVSNTGGSGFISGSVAADTAASLTINAVGYTTKPGLRIDQTSGNTALPLDVRLNSITVASIGPTGAGTFGISDAGTDTVTNGLTVRHASSGTPAAGLGSAIQFNINSSTTADQSAGNIATLWTDATHATVTSDFTLRLRNGGAALAETFRVKGNGLIVLPQTITTGGTTGNQTIDKIAGTVNVAAAGTTVTVTNALCSTSSTVYVMARTADATCAVKNVVPGAGSFVVNLTAACTSETSFGFIVFN